MAVSTANSIRRKIDFANVKSNHLATTNILNDQTQDKVHKIRLGICCMDKKCKAGHHKNVISRIKAYGDIEIIPFGDINILHKVINNTHT